MKKIIIGSRNLHKIRELKYLLKMHSLSKDIIIEDLTLYNNVSKVIEDGKTYEENCKKKALIYASEISEWVLADDSGIEVEALGWGPGIFSSRYFGKEGNDELNNIKLLEELKKKGCRDIESRRAKYVCVVCLTNPEGKFFIGKGECYGFIASEPHGKNGFGYDPIFFFPQYSRTFGEVSEDMKHKVSHRSMAVRELMKMVVASHPCENDKMY